MNKNLKKLLIFKSNTIPNTTTKWIVIKPLGGLSNMLRAIFSYYYKALDENKKLKVIWKESPACPGYFLNYFKPVENMIFDNNLNTNSIITNNACDCSKYTNNIYKNLKLLDFMEIKVKNNIECLGNNFIAVHIRRTDHTNLAKLHNRFTTDEDFIKFIEKYDTYNLYLATDNKDTQLKFYNKYKNRIKVITFIEENKNSLRKTLLEEAIIDMFTCSHANFFLGSGYSSFSTIIKKLIELKNVPV
jgi:hypothetical protein